MTSEKICKYEKFGFCNKKKECTEFHPLEVCKEEACNVFKCSKRHPQLCRYFQSGSCKFGNFCKYEHKKQINEKEILDRMEKLETDNKRIKSINEKQADTILDLNKRVNHLEKEILLTLKKYSNEEEAEQEKMDEDTSVNDDQLKANVPNESRKRKLSNDEEVKKKETGDADDTEDKNGLLQKVLEETLKSLVLLKSQWLISSKSDNWKDFVAMT